MSAALATYSFLDVVAALVGPGAVISFGNGAAVAEEGITIEPTEEINSMTIGADGSGMHNLHANKSGRLTVRVLKTSPVNALLAAAYALQTSSGALHGKNTITVANPVTGDVTTCQQVAFARATPLTYAKDGGMNDWLFHVVQIDRVLGALT